MFNYVVTAQKPTAVHHSVRCHFTSSDAVNLVVGKGHVLEIYTLTPDGLVLTTEADLFGRIATLESFNPHTPKSQPRHSSSSSNRMDIVGDSNDNDNSDNTNNNTNNNNQDNDYDYDYDGLDMMDSNDGLVQRRRGINRTSSNQPTDVLFVVTEKYQFAVLKYDSARGCIVTVCTGDASEHIGRQSVHGQVGIVDPLSRVIVLHLYQGLIKVIPIARPTSVAATSGRSSLGKRLAPSSRSHASSSSSSLSSAAAATAAAGASNTSVLLSPYSLRIDELNVIDIKFAHVPADHNPVLLVLFQDPYERRHLRSYTLNYTAQTLVNGPYQIQKNLECGVNLIVPVEATGGALIVGEETVVHLPSPYSVSQSSDDRERSAPSSSMTPSMRSAASQSTVSSSSANRAIKNEPMLQRITPSVFTAYGYVGLISAPDCADGTNLDCYIFGDDRGNITLLALALAPVQDSATFRCTAIKYAPIGNASVPTTLEYLDGGLLYVGSHGGDSQLLMMNDTPHDLLTRAEIAADAALLPNTLSVTDTFANLGPIMDFCVINRKGSSGGSKVRDESDVDCLITCSGIDKDGSLRVIRNCLGFNEHATIPLPYSALGAMYQNDEYITGIFTLQTGGRSTSRGDILVVSSLCDTRVFAVGISGDDLDDDEDAMDLDQPQNIQDVTLAELSAFGGFDLAQQTLCAAAVPHSTMAIQITSDSVRIVSTQSSQVVSSWPPSGQHASITSAKCFGAQILIAFNRNRLAHLLIKDDSLHVVAEAALDAEISCVDIASLSDHIITGKTMDAVPTSELCAVGTWRDSTISIRRMSTLREVAHVVIDDAGNAVPRNVILGNIALAERHVALSLAKGINRPPSYLSAAMSDGSVHFYSINQSNLAEVGSHRVIHLGPRPATISRTSPGRPAPSRWTVAEVLCDSNILASSPERSVIISSYVAFSSVTAASDTMAEHRLLTSPLAVRGVSAMAQLRVHPSQPSLHVLAFTPSAAERRENVPAVASLPLPQPLESAISELDVALRDFVLDDAEAVSCIRIGSIDRVQRLHVTTHKLDNESPAHIVHHPSAHSVCVLTTRLRNADSPSYSAEDGFVRLFDDRDFTLLDTFALGEHELGVSVALVPFHASSSRPLIVVGTAISRPGESEDSATGRILIFDIREQDSSLDSAEKIARLCLVAVRDCGGPVYSVTPFRGMFLSTVVNHVKLFGLSHSREQHNSNSGTENINSDGSSSGGDGDANNAPAGCAPQDPSNQQLPYHVDLLTWNSSFIQALYIAVNRQYHTLDSTKQSGDGLVAVGDLMRSLTLLQHSLSIAQRSAVAPGTRPVPIGRLAAGDVDPQVRAQLVDHHVLSEAAAHRQSLWTTAVAVITDPDTGEDRYLLADSSFNLTMFSQQTNPTSPAIPSTSAGVPSSANVIDAKRLQICGRWHLGDSINRVLPGRIVLHAAADTSRDRVSSRTASKVRPTLAESDTHLYATCDGAIGLIVPLTAYIFHILNAIQNAMAQRFTNQTTASSALSASNGGNTAATSQSSPPPSLSGTLDHATWRRFSNQQKTDDAFGFIDGNLVEEFLNLERAAQFKIVSAASEATGQAISAIDVIGLISELAQMH
ncbi:hypothetical protein GQ42DRAFT_80421 [Ramicandelaber brevisporus]|nr:hypothetical protein GQ42DRAFT_80421 [Ramicandelaber brevisporus]